MSPIQERVRVQKKEKVKKQTEGVGGLNMDRQQTGRRGVGGRQAPLGDSLSRIQTLFYIAGPFTNFQTHSKSHLTLTHTDTDTCTDPKTLLTSLASLQIFWRQLPRIWLTKRPTRPSCFCLFFFFLNGGPVYQVSWAVIYKATGRRSGVQGRGYFTGLKQTSNKGQ